MTTTTEKKPAARKKNTARKPVPAPTPANDASAPLEALVGDLPSGPRMVDLDRLVPHPRNPRTHIDPDDLQALADSIAAQGVRQNLLVVPDPGEEGRHMIVIGHRRAQAARLAGLGQVPAVVDPTLTEAQQLELMLVENMQRSDLTVVEEADGYQGLLDLGISQAEMARATGVSKSKVASRLKVAALPTEARTQLAAGRATLEDATALGEFEDDPDTHARLMKALGTNDWGWRINQARAEKRQQTAQAEARKALEDAGVTILDDHPNNGISPMNGQLPWAFAAEGDQIPGFLAEFVGDTDDLRAYQSYSWRLFRRRTDAELATQAQAPGSQGPDPKWEAEQAHREKVTADVRTAATLRAAFLLDLTTGRRRLTKQQEPQVLQTFMWLLLGRMIGDWVARDDDVQHWLTGKPVDDDHPQQHLNDLTATTPARVALAILAAQHEMSPDVEAGNRYWDPPVRSVDLLLEDDDAWQGSAEISDWYTLLQSLGYEPSSWERDRLAGVPLVEEPPAEAAAS